MSSKNTFTSLIAVALCLCFSAASANAQFSMKGKFGSISKNSGSKISPSGSSFPNTNLRGNSSFNRIGSGKSKLPITLPKRGIGLGKGKPITLPKPQITFPKPVTGINKPLPFPKPVTGIKQPLPIQVPKPGLGVRPKPGIVAPNHGPPKPVNKPHDADCWKPPHRCHWWTRICAPIKVCRPTDVVHCHWNIVHCNTVIGGHIVNARWYLGIEGVFLPGKGLGIESVAEGSPAAVVGLTAGMVIVQANGIAMETEEAMQRAIANSHGILQIVVISEGSPQPLQGTVQMVRLPATRF